MNQAQMKDCIDTCVKCHQVCQETLSYCMQQGGEHIEESHLKLMMDCVQACQTAADFMMRGSALHASECAACADVCEACAESCEKIDDVRMKACAEACRKCAKSCREMSKMKKAA